MGWTTITDASIDVDSPLNTDRITELRDNGEYNFDHALRGGTHGTGVRLAIARGTETLTSSWVGSDPWYTAVTETAITFSTDSTDGDPNFTSAPQIFITAEEDNATGNDWTTKYTVACPYVADGTRASTGFTIGCTASSSITVTGTFKVDLHWIAFGLVTSGE